MTVTRSGAYRPVNFAVSNQVTTDAVGSAQGDVKTVASERLPSGVELKPIRDSLDISLRSAINTMLATNPLVKTLSNEERAQLVSAVEFSLKQGLGISSLIRIIERSC